MLLVLQIQLQMQSIGGQTDNDAVSRFQQIASLLAMNSDVMAYLMSEMRLQQMMGDVFKILSEASGMNMDFLGN